ncbi:MAG: hypothetical protein C5B53_03575 [Candidatus Melainabacteria bacterium]|nr:MAG: hypothetical protein C5B53_03575 [Candidatus Melainabacteria bacterium]
MSPVAVENLDPTRKTVDALSPEARQLGEQIDVISPLTQLEKLSGENKDRSSDQTKLSILATRQEVLETLMATNYEIRFVTNRIDRELAKTNEILAYLAERRDRAIRVNTYANFISGGLTGMVRGGMGLGDVSHVPRDIIETAEGGVQSSLASWAFFEQKGERHLEQGVPSMIARVLQNGNQRPREFPASVWNYLNAPSSNERDGVTRRKALINRWIERKMCLIHHYGHRAAAEVHAARIAGTEGKVNIGVLEDRVAMLTDLRCAVTEMENLLFELIEACRASRVR